MQQTNTNVHRVVIRSAAGGTALALAAIALGACGSTATTPTPTQSESTGSIAKTTEALAPECTPRAKFEAVQTSGDPFPHRTGHAAATLGDELYIARGVADDIDTQTNTFRDDLFRGHLEGHDRADFSQLAENGAAIPGSLGFPCMASDDREGGSLLLFGGADYLFELNPGFFASFTPSNALWRYQVHTGTWTELAPSGALPSRRNGCSAARFGQSMYMFGGLSRFLAPDNELWRYDIDANTWQELSPSGSLPPPRFIAASALDEERGNFYVYNGLTATARGFDQIGDFWVYDIAGNSWRQITTTPTPPRNKGVFSLLSGPCGKRYLVYSTGNIDTTVHCTGFDENTTAINEVWAFDLEAETWQQLETVGDAPRLNFAQGATVNNKQVLVGGWYDVPDPVKVCRQVWNETAYEVSLVDR
jgi:hypothetical protein